MYEYWHIQNITYLHHKEPKKIQNHRIKIQEKQHNENHKPTKSKTTSSTKTSNINPSK